MKVIVANDYEEISKLGSQMIVELIQKKNNAVLGLATGSTPIGMYKELIRVAKEDKIDFSNVRTFNLDEYVSISPSHPQSYNHFMYSQLFNYINISPDNVHIPKGDNADLENECRQYEQRIKKAGGIDIQVLGIGSNGHIGFNEPGSNPQDRTRVVKLAESTIQDNKRFFGEENLVPRLAISMGIKTILESREIILLANGEEKSEALYQMIEGKITPDIPASFLQLHKNVTVLADTRAAKKLTNIHSLL